MRQGPHNKNRSRSRGRRPSGGGGNQSGRVYESNGPDVKVRGTAQTVADKYLQLARDAHSVGDTVMAEGYFQHAEHYLRILAASQPLPQQGTPQRRTDDYSYDDSDDGYDDQFTPVSSAMSNGSHGGPNHGATGHGGTGGGGNGEAQRQPRAEPQGERRGEPRGEPQHESQAEQSEAAPQDAPQDAPQAANDGGTGEQPWGGPEPEFLRRGPASNGASRPRRTRQPRNGKGRNGTPASTADGDEAASSTGSGGKPDAAGQDTGRQDSGEQNSNEQA